MKKKRKLNYPEFDAAYYDTPFRVNNLIIEIDEDFNDFKDYMIERKFGVRDGRDISQVEKVFEDALLEEWNQNIIDLDKLYSDKNFEDWLKDKYWNAAYVEGVWQSMFNTQDTLVGIYDEDAI